MPTIRQTMTERLKAAVTAALGPEHGETDPILRLAGNPKFGDYQANLAMGLAKKLKRPPREVAQEIVDALQMDDLCTETPGVAGPGFINLKLGDNFIEGSINALKEDGQLGVPAKAKPQTIVIDYSAPNVAKEMHVGHLRSTIIGDGLARVLGFLGHEVIRHNHVGDWGTQFGMLISHLMDEGWDQQGAHTVSDLNQLYQAAKKKFDRDDDFKERSRRQVVELQGGDKLSLELWQALVAESKRHFSVIYERLNVLLEEEDIVPESFYNPHLDEVVAELQELGLATESRGALCVFPPGFKTKEGDPLPVILRKGDGGYPYATTDLAALKYRIGKLGADRIIYVTDSRQKLHFAMLFKIAEMAGWLKGGVRLAHVPFGTILGEDNKPFKTRSGGTIRLSGLLDDAVKRASAIVRRKFEERNAEEGKPPPDDGELLPVAQAVGIGAVKYADLSNDRIKDYVFDWERMLSFQGNTAPYMQNAYVRIKSIFRKAESRSLALPREGAKIGLTDPAERDLCLKLLQFPDIAELVDATLEPHHLCTYMHELAAALHHFYQRCPVLSAEAEATRNSRLMLLELVARALSTGLGLLGIKVVEWM